VKIGSVIGTLPEAEVVAKLKKMRIKELRGILQERGVDSGKVAKFVEKDEYIREILTTQHLDL